MKDDTPACVFLIILGFFTLAIIIATNPASATWSDAGEISRTVGPLLTGAAAWFGAFIALKGLRKWRDEALGKRKAELAEQALAAFYCANDIIVHARHPLVLAHEMQSEEGLSDELATDADYAPAKRLFAEREHFSTLRSHRYAFAAVFGKDKAQPFQELIQIHNEIVDSAVDLIRWKDWKDQEGRAYTKNRRRVAFSLYLGSGLID